MTAINFNTSNQSFRQLLGNGLTYRVPRFQRDYSWDTDQWEDLWEDIKALVLPDGESAHYMGYLVLQTNNNREFDVIDGQQRMATLSIMVLAILKKLQNLVDADIDAANNTKRIEQLRQTYIGFLDPVTLITKSKLTLNRNNDVFYQKHLAPLLKLPQRGLKASDNLMKKAFEYFSEFIDNISPKIVNDGAELARFMDTISDKLFFTVITVTDELNAYKVFETLNARGVRLSPTDLLKNYLFSIVYKNDGNETEMTALEQSWETIVGKLGSESFPDFLRIHWNSRRKFVRESELFKKIRAFIKGKQESFQLLRDMEEDADTYAALSNPEDTFWNRDEKEYVSEMRTFNVRQPYALLLAARRILDNDSFAKILRACSIISFRYNVIGRLASNEEERVYNDVAEKIASKKLTGYNEIVRELRPVYLSDENFKNAFSEKILSTKQSRNKHVVRYLLFKLESQLSGRDHDPKSEKYTIEHILPQNPETGWEHFSQNDIESFAYRLGNMTILDAGANRNSGNESFDEKKNIYRNSSFEITKQIVAENREWTKERIGARQKQMAKWATSIWRIDQLSS